MHYLIAFLVISEDLCVVNNKIEQCNTISNAQSGRIHLRSAETENNVSTTNIH